MSNVRHDLNIHLLILIKFTHEDDPQSFFMIHSSIDINIEKGTIVRICNILAI